MTSPFCLCNRPRAVDDVLPRFVRKLLDGDFVPKSRVNPYLFREMVVALPGTWHNFTCCFVLFQCPFTLPQACKILYIKNLGGNDSQRPQTVTGHLPDSRWTSCHPRECLSWQSAMPRSTKLFPIEKGLTLSELGQSTNGMMRQGNTTNLLF